MLKKNFFLSLFFVFSVFYSQKYYKPKNAFLYSLKEYFNLNPRDFINVFGIYKSYFYKLEGDEVQEIIKKRLDFLNKKEKKNKSIEENIEFLKKCLRKVEKQKKIDKFFEKHSIKNEINLPFLNQNLKKIKKQKKITDYFQLKNKYKKTSELQIVNLEKEIFKMQIEK